MMTAHRESRWFPGTISYVCAFLHVRGNEETYEPAQVKRLPTVSKSAMMVKCSECNN